MRSLKRGRLQRIKTVSTCLFAIFFAFLLSACSESGSVGEGLAGIGTGIATDTLVINKVNIDTLTAYSGNLNYFSAGQFHDPLFGDIKATGLFKPLLAGRSDTLAFDSKTNMFLKLAVHSETVYGNKSGAQQFKLYEAQKLWRGNAWRINDNMKIGASPIANFSVANKDTITIPLPHSWVQKYAKYFNSNKASRDSSYIREFFGLVMVPAGSNKIVTVDPTETTFIATNLDAVPDTSYDDSVRLDSLAIGLRTWAYSVKRTNMSSPSVSSSKLLSTLKRVIRFDYKFKFKDEGIAPRNITRVELIFYADRALLERSINNAGADAVRPFPKRLNLHYVEPDELPQSISGAPHFTATYNKEDQAYHFNVTRAVLSGLFETTNASRVFYLTVGKRKGVIRSNLIFNNLASGKKPEVVVTYVKRKNK